MERSQNSRQPYDHGSGYQGSSRSASDQGDDNAYDFGPALDENGYPSHMNVSVAPYATMQPFSSSGTSSAPYPYPYPAAASPSPQGPYDYSTGFEQSVSVDELANQFERYQLAGNLASVDHDVWEAQRAFATSPADDRMPEPAPVTPPPPLDFAELEASTRAWEQWADQQVADGLTNLVTGEPFQLGTRPTQQEEVVVPDRSPLASPSHTPSGSPPLPPVGGPAGGPDVEAGRADTFALHEDGQTLMQRVKNGWQVVMDEEVRTRVLYALGSTLEAFGRSAGFSYAIATGNAVILGADIINRGQSIYNNITAPQVDMPRLARDTADVVGLTTGIAAGYTVISGVNKALSTDDHLVIDRSHVRAAGYLGGAAAVAYGAGAVFAGVDRNRTAAGPADTGSEPALPETFDR
ncbi:hypothetical protein, partial [Micromonospora sp. NPDC047527]|uniref:hypothetical protein n=1 Tax=Micromonospora sp. NPDC047527 TaxID=3155144 RepID=UPI0033C88601